MLSIKKHYLALFLAVVIGLIYASHHFFIPNFFPNEDGVYQPITPNEYYDESLFYAPKAAAVFWGRGVGGDFSTVEHQDSPSIAALLNPLILGWLMKIMASVKAGLIASDFVFPAVIFFLLYLLVYEITSAPPVSSVFALIFILAPKIALSWSEFLRGILPFKYPAMLHFSEFDEPKITFAFLALFAYLLMRAMSRGGRNNTILAGLSFGLLFYTYPYDWAMAATILFLMAGIFLIQRHPYLARRVVIIFGVGAVLSIFYWLNWLELSKVAPDVITRLGGEVGRFFRWETVWKHYLRMAILIPLLWYILRDSNKKAGVFLTAYLLSFVVAVNIQVITGFNAQPDHWYRTQFLPVALAVFLIIYNVFLRLRSENKIDYFLSLSKGYLGILAIFWIFGANIYGQYLYSAKYARAFYIPKDKYESYEWLKNNTPAHSVVGTLSFETNPAIQLFSRNKIFLPFGLSTTASNNELWERFMTGAKIFGLTPEDFKNLILREGGLYYLTVEQYGDKSFDAVFHDYDRIIHPDELSDRALDYAFYLRQDHEFKYQLDYLYYDKKDSRWGSDPARRLDDLKKVFENNAATIYKIIM